MLRDAYLKGLRDHRRALLFWSFAIAVHALLMALLFPSIRGGAADMQSYITSMLEAVRNAFMGESTDFTQPMTFLDAEFFSLMTPLLLLVFAIGLAAAQIAGEREGGSLSLLVARPLSRRRLLAQKLDVPSTGIAVVTAVHLEALALDSRATDMRLTAAELVEAHVNLALLVAAFAAVAFAAGAPTGRRALAITAGAGLAAATYLLNVLAPLVERFEPLRYMSPSTTTVVPNPLCTGLQPAHAAVLISVVVVAAAVAFVTFEHRDVRV